MAAGLALSRAEVLASPVGGEAVPYAGVSVLVRGGVGQLRRGRDVVATLDGVATVEVLTRRSWRVTGTDGSTWNITREACVPCGARRRTG